MTNTLATSIPRRLAVAAIGALVLAAVPHAAIAQTDPLIGTWRLNLARSTYTAGPMPRSLTVTYRGTGANLTATAEGVDAAGNPVRTVFMRIYDGQPHPTTGSPDYDASTYMRVDSNTIVFTRLKAGKLVGVGTQVLAQGGRTATNSTTGVTATGQAVKNVQIFEKQ